MQLFVITLIIVNLFSQCIAMSPETPNYYETLGVTKNASNNDIKKAYYKLAMKWHPDKNKGPKAQAMFQEISEAYETLSNPEKRQSYDLFGKFSTTIAPSAKEMAAELERMKQKFQEEFEAHKRQTIDKAVNDYRMKQEEQAEKMRTAFAPYKSPEEIEKELDIQGLTATKIEAAVQEYANALQKGVKPPKPSHLTALPSLDELCNSLDQLLKNKFDFTLGIKIENMLDQLLPNDIASAADDHLSLGHILNSYTQAWHQKLDQIDNPRLAIISDFIRKLLVKAGVTTHHELKNWITKTFILNFKLQKQLIALNLIAHERPVAQSKKTESADADENSLKNSLAKLQTKLTDLKHKLEQLSINLNTLKEKIGT